MDGLIIRKMNIISRDGDANADANVNAVDARHFEDANADAFRLGEDANAEANTLIGSRVRVLYLLFLLMVIEALNQA